MGPLDARLASEPEGEEGGGAEGEEEAAGADAFGVGSIAGALEEELGLAALLSGRLVPITSM